MPQKLWTAWLSDRAIAYAGRWSFGGLSYFMTTQRNGCYRTRRAWKESNTVGSAWGIRALWVPSLGRAWCALAPAQVVAYPSRKRCTFQYFTRTGTQRLASTARQQLE